MFTWIPIHEEAARKILGYEGSRGELLATLREMNQQGLKVISLAEKDASGQSTALAEIDPFTFLASFNRGIKDAHRRENWRFLKERWKLVAPVPEDFAGIPIVQNVQSWFFPWALGTSAGQPDAGG